MQPEEKLAIYHAAILLQRILSGEYDLDKNNGVNGIVQQLLQLSKGEGSQKPFTEKLMTPGSPEVTSSSSHVQIQSILTNMPKSPTSATSLSPAEIDLMFEEKFKALNDKIRAQYHAHNEEMKRLKTVLKESRIDIPSGNQMFAQRPAMSSSSTREASERKFAEVDSRLAHVELSLGMLAENQGVTMSAPKSLTSQQQAEFDKTREALFYTKRDIDVGWTRSKTVIHQIKNTIVVLFGGLRSST